MPTTSSRDTVQALLAAGDVTVDQVVEAAGVGKRQAYELLFPGQGRGQREDLTA